MTYRAKWLLPVLFVVLATGLAGLTALLMGRGSSEVATFRKVLSIGTANIGGSFALETADGETVTDETYRGKWMVIYFGYTFCPDACPTALNNMSLALQELGKDAEKIQPIFITVDPERDTRQVMSAYLESFDHRIVGLTGTRAQTDATAKTYRVYFALHKDQGENYPVDHSAYFYVMDPDGKFVHVIVGATPGDEIADKLRKLIAEHST